MATWDEIDWAERKWTVPAERMKSRREHQAPLAGRAIESSTFEYEFDFLVLTHQLYGSAKPDQSKRRRTSSTSRPAQIEPVPDRKHPGARKHKGNALTPSERNERERVNRGNKRECSVRWVGGKSAAARTVAKPGVRAVNSSAPPTGATRCGGIRRARVQSGPLIVLPAKP